MMGTVPMTAPLRRPDDREPAIRIPCTTPVLRGDPVNTNVTTDMAATTQDPSRWLDEHGDVLFAYAMKRVNHAATAEDLVQETLLAALIAATSYAGDSNESTWLIGILKHKILDHFRRASRSIFSASTDQIDADFDARFDDTGHWRSDPGAWAYPAAVLENDQLRGAIMRCVDKLPESLRTLFVLREIDGMETDALMETLGLSSRNNLWVMMSRARDRMRQCLEASWTNQG